MKNLIAISGPSGTGKTTLCRELQRKKQEINFSVSCTTRHQRYTEEEGVDYHFISHDEFEDLILNKDLSEWENVHGFYYGTPRSTLENAIAENKTVLLEMDVKGAIRIKELYPENSFSIFIIPPSIAHLRERLKKRGTDSEKRIEIRLQRFQQEMEFKDQFDHVMINENLNVATQELINVVNELKEGVLNGP